MTIVNLKKIAKSFSGVIFFDGEGTVEIREASAFYTFPSNEEIEDIVDNDGEIPKFSTLFSWIEQDSIGGYDCNKFNIDVLLNSAPIKEMNEIKTRFENLTDVQKRQFLDYANQF